MRVTPIKTFDHVRQFAEFELRRRDLPAGAREKVAHDTAVAIYTRKLPLTHAVVVRVARHRALDYIRKHRQPALCTVPQEVYDSNLRDSIRIEETLPPRSIVSNFNSEPTLKVAARTPRPRFTHRSIKRTPSVQPERYVARSRCEVDLRTVAA